MNKKHAFWGLFLGSCAVIAAVPEFWSEDNRDAVPPAARKSTPVGTLAYAAPVAAAAAATAKKVPEDRAAAGSKGSSAEAAPIRDIFAAKSWAPPPPKVVIAPPPPPPPPPPPTAPPMPYKFMGKMDDATSLKAFLNRGDRVYVVSVGEILDNTYRVESIKSGQMTMTYLPLNIPQTLSVGSAL